ncbi:MAG: FG-GAP-like repeat-containing protein [Candidatus Neomarinimicrobiota bacterium]
MIRKISITVLVVLFIVAMPVRILALAGFERSDLIAIPEPELNVGGVGNLISGVDLDGDGRTEIYLVNDNWADAESEKIPRIYKLELVDNAWQVVWQSIAPVEAQNTWPPLLITDLDSDGKDELTWLIVNFTTTTSPNPFRVVVYEEAGDGSDVLGVSDGFGGYYPNAMWTITDTDNLEIRPASAAAADVDNDGTVELIFADRKGNNGGYYFGVISVDDIPDDGSGFETWTMETCGLDHTLSDKIDNKWDVAVVGSNMYFFDEFEISKVAWDGSDYVYSTLAPLPGGISFNSVEVVDLDEDGIQEMITGELTYGDTTRHIWLLQEDGDTLKRTALVDINTEELLNGGFLGGGAQGDIDQDGYLDLVFGSRYSGPPNAMIFRLAYRGGEISDPASYEFSVIDTGIVSSGGYWTVVNIADIDGDGELEVLYTSSSSVSGEAGAESHPIVVLDYDPAYINVQTDVLPKSILIGRNYPNPFNPLTKIEYQLAEAARVKVVVLNLLGQEIKVLEAGPVPAGLRSVVWDATDQLGIPVGSGVYLYQIDTESERYNGKMIYLK